MLNTLPLLSGWKYLIKGITEPITTSQKVITIIDESDIPGWFLTGDVVTSDPNLLLQVYIDGNLVQQISASEAYFFGSRNTQGPPMSFMYGQYAQGINFPLYGIGMYNLNGYPISNNFKAVLQTQLPELFIATYDVILAKIYDTKAFLNSYKTQFGNSVNIGVTQ
jgi:hypothetical protein